jgi:hypothetical protein
MFAGLSNFFSKKTPCVYNVGDIVKYQNFYGKITNCSNNKYTFEYFIIEQKLSAQRTFFYWSPVFKVIKDITIDKLSTDLDIRKHI